MVAYSGITVTSGETLQLAAGDTASNVTVASGGTLTVSSGGSATGTIIDAGGTENVLASGSALSTTLSGGTMNFGSGASLGSPAKITFASGGTLRILDFLTYFNFFPTISGIGAGDIIDLASFADPRSVPTSAFIDFSGNTLDVSQNGVRQFFLDSHVSYSGYHFFALPDGTGGTEILVGAIQNYSGVSVGAGQTLTLSAANTATNALVTSGGTLAVSLGGVANGTVVSTGGQETVYSGGVASRTSITSGGVETVLGGGSATSTMVYSGGLQSVSSGGTASAATVSAGGELMVQAGGLLVGTTTVLADGLISSAIVGSGGTLLLQGGALVSGTISIMAGGTEAVGSGYTVSGFFVSSGETLEVMSGGVAIGTTVSSGGTLLLLSGALVSGTTSFMAGGAEAVGSGYAASGFIVSSGITLEVASGGVAIGTVVSSGGALLLLSGGTEIIAASSTFEIVNGGIAGAGSIDFTGAGTLKIDGQTMPLNRISGFGLGDTIDLAGVSFANGGSIQLGTGNALKLFENGSSYSLQLDPAQSYSGKSFRLLSDGSGGTDIQVVSGLTINVAYDTSVASAPTGFRSGVAYAINQLEGLFTNRRHTQHHHGLWGVSRERPRQQCPRRKRTGLCRSIIHLQPGAPSPDQRGRTGRLYPSGVKSEYPNFGCRAGRTEGLGTDHIRWVRRYLRRLCRLQQQQHFLLLGRCRTLESQRLLLRRRRRARNHRDHGPDLMAKLREQSVGDGPVPLRLARRSSIHHRRSVLFLDRRRCHLARRLEQLRHRQRRRPRRLGFTPPETTRSTTTASPACSTR